MLTGRPFRPGEVGTVDGLVGEAFRGERPKFFRCGSASSMISEFCLSPSLRTTTDSSRAAEKTPSRRMGRTSRRKSGNPCAPRPVRPPKQRRGRSAGRRLGAAAASLHRGTPAGPPYPRRLSRSLSRRCNPPASQCTGLTRPTASGRPATACLRCQRGQCHTRHACRLASRADPAACRAGRLPPLRWP